MESIDTKIVYMIRKRLLFIRTINGGINIQKIMLMLHKEILINRLKQITKKKKKKSKKQTYDDLCISKSVLHTQSQLSYNLKYREACTFLLSSNFMEEFSYKSIASK